MPKKIFSTRINKASDCYSAQSVDPLGAEEGAPSLLIRVERSTPTFDCVFIPASHPHGAAFGFSSTNDSFSVCGGISKTNQAAVIHTWTHVCPLDSGSTEIKKRIFAAVKYLAEAGGCWERRPYNTSRTLRAAVMQQRSSTQLQAER